MFGGGRKNYIQSQDTTLLRTAQDTLLIPTTADSILAGHGQDTISVTGEGKTDTLPDKTFSLDEIHSIFERSDRHQETLDSVSLVEQRPSFPTVSVNQTIREVILDSNHIIILIDSYGTPSPPDFSLDIPESRFANPERVSEIFIEQPSNKGKEKQTSSEVPGVEPHRISREKSTLSLDWILLILVTSFITLAWIRLFYNKFLFPSFQALFNSQLSYTLFQDKSSLSFRVSAGLNFIFYLNAGLFIFLIFNYFGIGNSSWVGLKASLIYSAILLALFMLKHVACSLTGFISLTHEAFSEYLHTVFLFNRNLGLFLFPVLLGVVYMSDVLSPVFIYSGLTLICIMYVLRIFRGFQIFIRKGFSIFYMILYLCALEIFPILLFFKVFLLVT